MQAKAIEHDVLFINLNVGIQKNKALIADHVASQFRNELSDKNRIDWRTHCCRLSTVCVQWFLSQAISEFIYDVKCDTVIHSV